MPYKDPATRNKNKLRRKIIMSAKDSGVFDQNAFFNSRGLAEDYYGLKDREREKEEREARARQKREADDADRRVAAGKPLKSSVRIRQFVPERIIGNLYRSQHGRCAICDKELHDHFMVDHDHATNMVRGLLCLQCNVMIGLAHDNADVLSRGAKYIKKAGRLPDVVQPLATNSLFTVIGNSPAIDAASRNDPYPTPC